MPANGYIYCSWNKCEFISTYTWNVYFTQQTPIKIDTNALNWVNEWYKWDACTSADKTVWPRTHAHRLTNKKLSIQFDTPVYYNVEHELCEHTFRIHTIANVVNLDGI